MLIHYADGTSREGVILSLKSDQMRVAVAGSDDVCEFLLRGSHWISGELEVVSFSFPVGASGCEQIARAAQEPHHVAAHPHRPRRALQ